MLSRNKIKWVCLMGVTTRSEGANLWRNLNALWRKSVDFIIFLCVQKTLNLEKILEETTVCNSGRRPTLNCFNSASLSLDSSNSSFISSNCLFKTDNCILTTYISSCSCALVTWSYRGKNSYMFTVISTSSLSPICK